MKYKEIVENKENILYDIKKISNDNGIEADNFYTSLKQLANISTVDLSNKIFDLSRPDVSIFIIAAWHQYLMMIKGEWDVEGASYRKFVDALEKVESGMDDKKIEKIIILFLRKISQ